MGGCSMRWVKTTLSSSHFPFVLQDSMLESLDAKVAEVQRCLVEDRSPNQTTLEKLATVENCMTVVLQSLESMPEESLKMLKKIMDRERRTRSDFFYGILCCPHTRYDSHRWDGSWRFNPPVCPIQAARGEPARTAVEAGREAEEIFGEIAR